MVSIKTLDKTIFLFAPKNHFNYKLIEKLDVVPLYLEYFSEDNPRRKRRI